MIRRFLLNYIDRHRHPVNQLLHVIGLPVTFILPIIFLVQERPWWWALGSFLLGYALQFAGHAVEGNDAGEAILVKKALGMPYIDIVERRNQSSPDA
ncbi:Mpo1-like protein [Planctomicrobium sp. SH661]|uniref:Mpo1-like protein n=1 Tax=Planctomicrobium sp. SH661 TaxID=3448124 RepID=UPI003F5C07E9